MVSRPTTGARLIKFVWAAAAGALCTYWALAVRPSDAHGSAQQRPQHSAEQHAASKLVVLSNHHDDPAWALRIGDRLGIPVKVYTNNPQASPRITPEVAAGQGMEARNYVAAILDNWDSLPDAVVFMHAHERSWHTKVGHAPNSSAWKLENVRWRTREAYAPLACQRHPYQVIKMFEADGKSTPACYIKDSPLLWLDAWEAHFGKWLPDPRHRTDQASKPPITVASSCCAEFIATREGIRQYPRRFWEETIAWMDAFQQDPDKLGPGFVMEFMWHMILSTHHEGVFPWAFLQEDTCLCYMYDLRCDSPTAMWYLNPAASSPP